MGTLDDLLEIRYGKDHKKLNDGNIPVYGSGGYMRSVDRFLYSGESVLVPRKGSLNNVMYVREKFWTVDTMFYAVPKSPNVAKYAYQFIKRLDLASMNSGSAVPSMTTKILNALPVPIPPKESLHAFDDRLQPYYSAICANAIENELLAALRDALLPKLMSGEIDVSKVNLTQLNSHLAETLRPFGCHIPAIQKTGQLALLRTAPYPRPSRYSANQRHSPTYQISRQTIPCVWASPLGRNPRPPLPPDAAVRRLHGVRSGIGRAI